MAERQAKERAVTYPVTVLTLHAKARQVGQARARRKGWSGVEFVRVGDFEFNLTSAYVPGEPIAFRLRAGQTYRVTLEDLGQPFATFDALRSDVRTSDGLSFFSKALPVNVRDEEDARRLRKKALAVWTDGIMLTVDSKQRPLKRDWLYRVTVQHLQDAAATAA